MKNFFTKLHYSKEYKLSEKLIYTVLLPISYAYSTIAEIRNFLYKKHYIKTYTPTVKTISVGNLTTGGTGKTPLTAALANNLTAKGYKVAILSRGYGSKLNSKNINIISDGKTIFYNAQNGGDEPVWLAQNCPNTMVLTSANRIQLAQKAEELGCNMLILDDGFQHQKLERNINIAVIDSEKQFGNKKVLPAGPLRESVKNLKRANKIVIVCKNNKHSSNNLIETIKQYNPNAEISFCKIKAQSTYNIQNNTEENIADKRIFAFSAIGQPEQFYNLLRLNKANVIKTISFPDHHSYQSEDINKILSEANEINADLIITTEKDAVKIKQLTDKAIYALKLGIDWDAENILNI